MTCVVSEGDSPLKITWLKDGRPLESREASTHHIDEFDLALRIQSASTAHNGNYTCVASNDAAKTTYTASLLVHGTQGLPRFPPGYTSTPPPRDSSRSNTPRTPVQSATAMTVVCPVPLSICAEKNREVECSFPWFPECHHRRR